MNCLKNWSALTWSWLIKSKYNGDWLQKVRILGLDPGEKKIGVAITDPLGITAQGLAVIAFDCLDHALAEIAAICRKYGVEKIVVGNPINMNGTTGPAAENAATFAASLRKKLDLPVDMVDERLTSISAEKTLVSAGVSRKNRRELKDKLAAVIILESYLAFK